MKRKWILLFLVAIGALILVILAKRKSPSQALRIGCITPLTGGRNVRSGHETGLGLGCSEGEFRWRGQRQENRSHIERNGCNDIFEIRRNYPRTLLFGNVCCETTLLYGTLKEVENETLELVERLGPSGGILIGSSSEVHDLVPAENALRMYGTVRKYGSYPINVGRS